MFLYFLFFSILLFIYSVFFRVRLRSVAFTPLFSPLCAIVFSRWLAFNPACYRVAIKHAALHCAQNGRH